jgi:hypothetical protein
MPRKHYYRKRKKKLSFNHKLSLSNSAHKRLQEKNFQFKQNEEDPNKHINYYGKSIYHRDAVWQQEKLNRKMNKKEKQHLFEVSNQMAKRVYYG